MGIYRDSERKAIPTLAQKDEERRELSKLVDAYELEHGPVETLPTQAGREVSFATVSAAIEHRKAATKLQKQTKPAAKVVNATSSAIAREKARKAGEKHYIGTPCEKAGHTLRVVTSSSCVQCGKDYKRDKRKKPPSKAVK